MAEPRPGPPSAPQCSQFPLPSNSQCSQLPPPSAPSNSQCSQLLPPSMRGLIPPSHFVLRSRSLGAELHSERGRGHDVEAELGAEKGRSQRLEAELEAERGRSKALEVELEAERRRGQQLEAELGAERRRGQQLEAELGAEKGRGQHLEAELEAEKGRSQRMEAELEAEKGRSHAMKAELDALRGRGQKMEAELEAEKGRSQILEMELEALRGRSLGTEGAEPSPEQVLLARWRHKVFQLLLQVRLHQSQELRLHGQVRSLDAAVAAGSRQVSLLELKLRRGEQELRGERQALSQERLRAEAAEEELGKLGQALSRLLVALSLSLADVTAALGALGTLSQRLGRAQSRTRALVASGRLRWQRGPEGTARDRGAVAPQVTSQQPRGWHPGDTGGGSVPKVSPPGHPRATEGGDRTRPRPDTVSLAPLLTQLQALGAAILGDSGDVIEGTVVTSLRGQR